MAQKRAKKTNKKEWAARVIIFVILAAALLLSLIWADPINRALGLKRLDESEYGGAKTDEVLDSGELSVHFVDVGQGDACILELPDGKTMLIDGGPGSGEAKLLDYIDKNVDFRTAQKRFDYAILTHSDEDHCGGMDAVLQKYPADVFYRPNEKSTYSGYTDPFADKLKKPFGSQSTAAYKKALEQGHQTGTTVVLSDAADAETRVISRYEDKTRPDNYTISLYSPTKTTYTDRNNYSPIIIIEYMDKRIAVSGDAEKEAEELFISSIKSGDPYYALFDDGFTVDAIKLGHHGSRTSSGEQYLQALTTDASAKDVKLIISCGKDNKYKHPHPEVLDRAEKLKFGAENILRTDVNGDVALSIKNDGGQYLLFAGADVVRVDKYSVSAGKVRLSWTEISCVIIVAGFGILIVAPLTGQKRRRTSGKRKAS